MNQTDVARLKELSLFASLCDDRLQRLARNAMQPSFPAGAQLFRQGDPPDFLYVLIDGKVQLTAESADGKETLMEVVQPVDCFILAAVLTDTPCLMAARTLEPSTVLMIPASDIRHQVHEDGELALTLLGSLATQFRGMVRIVKNLKLRTASQRVGCYLMSLCEDEDDHASVTLDLDKQLIASRLGITRETLSRAFSSLGQYGVRVQREVVHLDDLPRLREYCQPDRLIDDVEHDLHV